jgi:D-glycero-alpha-D-manno-heptose 1-phosphate guanylyltransferase
MPKTDEAIILAGGFGTRLQSVVKDVPKPLAPVAGRPFLAYLLDLLDSQGVRRVVLATGYLAEVVESTLGHSWNGMSLVYSREHEPLGTGGAMVQAMSQIHGDTCFVLNGDTYLALDYERFDQIADADGCSIGMALAQVDDTARYGAVIVDGRRVVGFSEKGRQGSGYVNAGVYRLSRDAIRHFRQGEVFSFEHAVLVPAAAGTSVCGYTQTRDFIDIGVPEDYEWAQRMFEPRT